MDALMLELTIYLVAMILLIVEVFVPAGGALGLGAIICFIYSIYHAFDRDAPVAGSIFIVITVAYLIGIVFLWLRVVQHRTDLSEADSTGEDVHAAESLVGRTGKSVTPLRPAGIATIAGQRYDVVTAGEFIEGGATVLVMEAAANRILVREVEGSGPS